MPSLTLLTVHTGTFRLRQGHCECVDALLAQRSANIAARDKAGRNALMLAAMCGQVGIVYALMYTCVDGAVRACVCLCGCACVWLHPTISGAWQRIGGGQQESKWLDS